MAELVVVHRGIDHQSLPRVDSRVFESVEEVQLKLDRGFIEREEILEQQVDDSVSLGEALGQVGPVGLALGLWHLVVDLLLSLEGPVVGTKEVTGCHTHFGVTHRSVPCLGVHTHHAWEFRVLDLVARSFAKL